MLYTVLSTIHTLFWPVIFGYYVYWGVVLVQSRNSGLDPETEHRFTSATLKVLPPFIAATWFVVLITGAWMAFIKGWELLIALGLLATVIAIVIGIRGMIPVTKGILAGKSDLFARLDKFETVNFWLVMFIMAVMLISGII